MTLPKSTDADCMKCRYCTLDGGEDDYSDITPGSPLRFSCDLGHWKLIRDEVSRQSLSKTFQMAKICGDYEVEE